MCSDRYTPRDTLSPASEAQQAAHGLYEPAHDPAAHHLPEAHALQPQPPKDQRQALKWVWRPAAARHAEVSAAACMTPQELSSLGNMQILHSTALHSTRHNCCSRP